MDVAVPGQRLREGVRGEFRALGAPGSAGDAGTRRPTVSGHRHGEEGRVWLHAVPGEGGLFRRGQRGSVERGARPGPGRSWGESVRLSRGFSEAPAQRHLLQEAHRTAHPASLETESLPDRISQRRPESHWREARRGVARRGVPHIFPMRVKRARRLI